MPGGPSATTPDHPPSVLGHRPSTVRIPSPTHGNRNEDGRRGIFESPPRAGCKGGARPSIGGRLRQAAPPRDRALPGGPDGPVAPALAPAAAPGEGPRPAGRGRRSPRDDRGDGPRG